MKARRKIELQIEKKAPRPLAEKSAIQTNFVGVGTRSSNVEATSSGECCNATVRRTYRIHVESACFTVPCRLQLS